MGGKPVYLCANFCYSEKLRHKPLGFLLNFVHLSGASLSSSYGLRGLSICTICALYVYVLLLTISLSFIFSSS